MIRLIVPSFNDDLLEDLFVSLNTSQQGSVRSVIVGDNGLSQDFRDRWPQALYIHVDVPFIYAQAINRCAAAAAGADLVILEDDMKMLSDRWRARLERLAEVERSTYSDFGVLQLSELGQPIYPAPSLSEHHVSPTTVGLGVSFIRSEVWKQIGPMDERYVGYGYEDTDYCLRLLHAGYRLGVTSAARVEHIGGQVGYTRRYESYAGVLDRCRINYDLFHEKWGIPIPENREIKFVEAAPHYMRSSCGCRD